MHLHVVGLCHHVERVLLLDWSELVAEYLLVSELLLGDGVLDLLGLGKFVVLMALFELLHLLPVGFLGSRLDLV